jgi:hypothetical protein
MQFIMPSTPSSRTWSAEHYSAVKGRRDFTLALLGWRGLSETYGKNLDYLEIA